VLEPAVTKCLVYSPVGFEVFRSSATLHGFCKYHVAVVVVDDKEVQVAFARRGGVESVRLGQKKFGLSRVERMRRFCVFVRLEVMSR
jgi:hypothetical protein